MKHPHPYIEADKEIVFMEGDPDLHPITFQLPPPATFEQTLYYGEDPIEQRWRMFDIPPKLVELNADRSLVASQKIEAMESNQSYYADEIEFIRRDQYYILNGLTIFIKGKQYYISGDNYFWLQHWRIEGKPVQFRMRDWKSWMFDYMVDHDPDIIGTNYPKHRREGCTNRRKCKQYRIAMTTAFAVCGMQSKDEKHAREIHEQMLLPVWRDYIPFWLRPIWNGQNNDTSSLRFTSPTAKRDPDYGRKANNSMIDFRDSGEKAYDGLKLKDLFNDEVGKTTESDIKRRFDIQRQCVMEGSTIVGKIFNGSTVDEMEKGGGRNFKRLCDQSHYHKRNPVTNRTTSFLVNFFLPASEGFDGGVPQNLQKRFGATRWIDEYGFDVIDPETGRPAAETYHLSVRRSYELAGDIEGLIEYTRQFPLRWKDCWKTTVKDCNFNLAILDARIEELEDNNPYKQRGNFMWLNGVQDGQVIWVPDPEGKFFLSYQFPDPRDANAYYMQDGIKVPANTRRFCAGADPFKFKQTKSGRKSNGGGAVFMKHDPKIDPNEKEIREWRTNRFVCTYSNRPKDKRTYGEDMIMMCHYFGCLLNPEINVDFLWDYFDSRGYGRYLYYSVDQKKNKVSVTPGGNTGEKTKEDIFREYQYFIQHFGMNEVHDELLIECRDIEDDMGDFDLFTSGGYALMANDKSTKYTPAEQQEADILDLFAPIYLN